MQRISLPQMVVALVCTNTCPCPGTGTSKSFSSTVLSPGSTAPFINIFTAIFSSLSADGTPANPYFSSLLIISETSRLFKQDICRLFYKNVVFLYLFYGII
jgi:hypothetical protein